MFHYTKLTSQESPLDVLLGLFLSLWRRIFTSLIICFPNGLNLFGCFFFHRFFLNFNFLFWRIFIIIWICISCFTYSHINTIWTIINFIWCEDFLKYRQYFHSHFLLEHQDDQFFFRSCHGEFHFFYWICILILIRYITGIKIISGLFDRSSDGVIFTRGFDGVIGRSFSFLEK